MSANVWRARAQWLARVGAMVAALAGIAGTSWAAAEFNGPPRRVAAAAEDPLHARVIVRYRAAALPGLAAQSAQLRQAQAMATPAARAQAVATAALPQHAALMGRRLKLALRDHHALGQRMQAIHADGLSSSALAARLAVQPEVEWAEPARLRRAAGVVPNDLLYHDGQTSATPLVGQWYLRPPTATTPGAMDAEGAWALTLGSPSVTVAVVDTGVRYDHPDLAGKLWPGYDFVRASISNDGDGPDANANDPGDWSIASDSCGASNSSWHGTQVASLVGAATDNGLGMASVGRNVMVLPVRVLGKCGGWDDDILAGVRWAANLGGSGAPPNPHPAQVINMSLGESGSCSLSYSSVFSELAVARVTVVAAAGNTDADALGNYIGDMYVTAPGNCPGVIAVGAIRHVGTKVGFSRLGPEVAISAPGGNCVNTGSGDPCLYALVAATDSGTQDPLASSYTTSYSFDVGTSFSAPMVAGVAGLMLSANPYLTPAQVRSTLQATARPFPTTGALTTDVTACQPPSATQQLECYCTTSTCGAGMLDARAAVNAVAGPVVAISSSADSVIAGGSVSFDASGSTGGVSGAPINTWSWQISDSGTDARISAGSTSGPALTLTLPRAGSVTVTVTATDTGGRSTSASRSVTVTSATGGGGSGSGSSSGGGALGAGWLLGLALAAWALRRPRANA